MSKGVSVKMKIYSILVGFCVLFSISCSTTTEKKTAQTKKAVPSKISAKERYAFVYDSIDAEHKIDQLDTLLYSKFMQNGFNGCMLIYQKGVFLHRSCYGYTCLSCKEKDTIDFNTKFQLASLSKTFTAVAVLNYLNRINCL